jgi:hypothetical protein
MSLSQYQATWANYFSPSQSGFYTPINTNTSNMGGLTDPFSGLSVAVMGAGGGSSASGLSTWTLLEYALIAVAVIAAIHFVEAI